jgi:hypothetical protein
MPNSTHKGSCLCGAVTIEVAGDLPGAEACHCTFCRRWSGHVGVSVEVPRSRVTIDGEEHLGWYHSSEKARRGFCRICGTSLFFDPLDREKHDWTGILMGAFDTPTGTRLSHHIFVAEKGDYYEITDGLPQNEY